MRFIKKAWRGEEPLWRALWVYNVLLAAIFLFLFGPILATGSRLLLTVYGLLFLPCAAWALVSLWRCASNSHWFWDAWVKISIMIGGAVGIFAMAADFLSPQ